MEPAGLDEDLPRQSEWAFSLSSLYTTPMAMRGILVAVALVTLLGCHPEAGSSDAVNTDTCELITGWVIDETLLCIDWNNRIDVGCMDTTRPHSDMRDCYENRESGVRAVTPQIYPELLAQGWRECESGWGSNVEETCL